MKNEYIAHINDETREIQSVCAHSRNTAALARDFAVEPLKETAFTMGLLHDIGKYQPSFQARILGKDIRVEHSICGAKVAKDIYKNAFSYLLQYCIAGHHGGLPNGGDSYDTADMSTLHGRLKRDSEAFSAYKDDFSPPAVDENQFNQFLMTDCTDKNQLIEKFAFVARYCFSCLTDADSLDTGAFCGTSHNRELMADFAACLQKINQKLKSFKIETPLQGARADLQAQVYEKSNTNAKIFLMNMPTGSGKTLCSMKFALERAIRLHKKRIIYIIPYNSIIDQTASVFEELFGNSAEILRHQSSFSYDDCDLDEDYRAVLKSSAENWNAQIILTTAVQFFESVYANRRGKLRKLHNMADSILIFDEAHTLPLDFLQPCLQAVVHITEVLNSEAVFLTATMPNFEKLLHTYAPVPGEIADLITNRNVFRPFKKCTYKNIGCIGEDALLQRVTQAASTLLVVNTKKTAQQLYALCKESGGEVYHLSTYMTAYDRKRTIDDIKAALQQLRSEFPLLENVPAERKILVISTSLIEAGVDLDFCSAFRQLSGLDNILQTGGRCNREGRLQNAEVFVFTLESDAGKIAKDVRTEITKGLLAEFSDITSPQCIEAYYERLFFIRSNRIERHRITNICTQIPSIPFADYAKEFRLIDSDSVSLIAVCDKTSAELVEDLKIKGFTNHRQLQKYACSIHESELADLQNQGAVQNYNGVWVLENNSYYSREVGIGFEASDLYL